jgi:hypothetical protein
MKLEDNIKINLRERSCDEVKGIEMGENNDLQETSVLGVQKFWVLVPENL